MQTRPMIFVFSAVLLVPFVYAISYIPDVCAAPADPNWGTKGGCDIIEETQRMTCCWQEPDINNPGEFIWWCQTCDAGGKNCDAIFRKQSTEPMGIPPGGVLEDPSTPPKLGQNVPPKDGGVLEQPENNMTFSKSNVPFPQANDSDDNMTFSKSNVPFPQANDSDDNTNNTLALLQSDVENDTAENNTGETPAEEEQDGSEENENSNEEEDE